MSRTVEIEWSGGTVTGRWRKPRASSEPAMLLAHGAGTNQDHESIVELREGLAAGGHPVLTFNYPYTERGSGRPDRPAVLLDCHRAAGAWLRDHVEGSVVYAGRSMGGRIATLLAAEGEEMAGLVLYAYPLHPAGMPDRLRTEHLGSIAAPMHFFAGTRDPLSRMDLFDRWIRPLPGATVTIIEDGDHSFRVPKRTDRSRAEVIDGIVATTLDWMRHL